MKKIVFSLALHFLITSGLIAQKLNVDYTTAFDTLESPHLLNFKKDGTAFLRFPMRQGVHWDYLNYEPVTFSFSNIGDTLHITSSTVGDSIKYNTVVSRIQYSRFVVMPKNQLVDLNSGYTYVLYKQTRKMKYGAIAYENKIYLIKRHGRSLSIRHIIKGLSPDNFNAKILKGKEAFDKYGIKGINGVIEIHKE